MKQCYHTIIKPQPKGWYVGWVEEVPGTITHGKSLAECRDKLQDSLKLMIEIHRDDARRGMDSSCIEEAIEIDVVDAAHPPALSVS